jgi:hypothetical protein
MAKWINLSEQQKQVWGEWLTTRPQVIQDMASKYNLHPELVYRIRGGNDRCTIHSLSENGTITVEISAEHNKDNPIFLFDRCVFGVDPETLIEVDYPFDVVDGTHFEDLEDIENGS